MFITRMRWKTIYFNCKTNLSERYGLKTLKCWKQVKELVSFENDLIDMLRVIKFHKVKTSSLQNKEMTPKQLNNPKKRHQNS